MTQQPIDLSQLFSRRDSRPIQQGTPITGLVSAADRIAVPLDLRSAVAPASRRELTRPS